HSLCPVFKQALRHPGMPRSARLDLVSRSPLPWAGRGDGDRGRCGRRSAVLDDLEYDDSEPPAIALVPAGVPWDDIQGHSKIAHHPLVVLPAGGTEYAGAYWTGTAMAVIEDLGPDQDQAIGEF